MQVSLSRLRSAGFNTIFRDDFLYLYHHAKGVCLRLRPNSDTIIHPPWEKIFPPDDFFAISALCYCFDDDICDFCSGRKHVGIVPGPVAEDLQQCPLCGSDLTLVEQQDETTVQLYCEREQITFQRLTREAVPKKPVKSEKQGALMDSDLALG